MLTEREISSAPEAIDRLAARAVNYFEVELILHFALEEQLLFPALPDFSGIAGYIADHRRMEALVGRLRQNPTAETLLEFTALLRSHIRCEENELFEEVQRRLPREILDALGAENSRRDAPVCL